MGIRSWYRKRKRAELLGKSHTRYWHDPQTGDTWQANSRYSPFVVGANSPESIAQMYQMAHLCDLCEEGEKYLPEKYAHEVGR